MNNNNYATGFGWMFNQLGLKGNDAWVYALIYGFSQDGKSQFEGSLSYIQDTFNLSRNTVINILKKLESNNHIVKHQIVKNKVVYNTYSLGSSISALGSAKTDIGVVQKLTLGSAKTAPNITNNNTKEIFIEKASDFLIKKHPIRYEQQFLMRFESQFKTKAALNDFIEDFDLVWDGEDFEKQTNLFGELIRYAKNKVRFVRVNGNEAVKVIRPEFKKIG